MTKQKESSKLRKEDKDIKNSDWISDLSTNPEFKRLFIKGLERLGFPLEFRIKKKLTNLGFQNIQEGHFSVFDSKIETAKTFDISCNKSKDCKILKDLTIHFDLQIIGDCKASSDNDKFLFAVPETMNYENKMFIGPVLTNLQVANYGVYRNQEIASNFLAKFGSIFLASDVKETSKAVIMDAYERALPKYKDIPNFESIYDICENTIIPALYDKYKRWRDMMVMDYHKLFQDLNNRDIEYQISALAKQFISTKLMIPIIVTTKPILVPLTLNGELSDLQKVNFVAYTHSVMNPDKYKELMFNGYSVLVFVCNEEGFDDLVKHINQFAEKVFSEISRNLNKHPQRLLEDYKEILKQNSDLNNMDNLIIPCSNY
jgi:hypothetical protein